MQDAQVETADAPAERLLLNAKEAAEFLGLSKSQFDRLAARGKMPFVPVSGELNGKKGRYQHKRYSKEGLRRWVRENEVVSSR